MKIMDIIIDEMNKNLDCDVKRLNSEKYKIIQTKNGLFKNNIKASKKIEKELKIYKAEFEDDEIEILEAYTDNEACNESWKLEKEHGSLFNLYLLDDDYNEIETII